jgi:hypothetical protein
MQAPTNSVGIVDDPLGIERGASVDTAVMIGAEPGVSIWRCSTPTAGISVQWTKRGWRTPKRAALDHRGRGERHGYNRKHDDYPAHPCRGGDRETDTRHDRQPGSEAQRAFRQ